jgi:hypothetical protein
MTGTGGNLKPLAADYKPVSPEIDDGARISDFRIISLD